VYELWVKMYPEITPDTFEEWESMIGKTSKHKAFTNASFEMIADMDGSNAGVVESSETEKEEVVPDENDEGQEEVVG